MNNFKRKLLPIVVTAQERVRFDTQKNDRRGEERTHAEFCQAIKKAGFMFEMTGMAFSKACWEVSGSDRHQIKRRLTQSAYSVIVRGWKVRIIKKINK